MALWRGSNPSDTSTIAPHSRFDQPIAFDDDGSDPEPGAYSPRPDPNEGRFRKSDAQSQKMRKFDIRSSGMN
jgi:hypothetical protein